MNEVLVCSHDQATRVMHIKTKDHDGMDDKGREGKEQYRALETSWIEAIRGRNRMIEKPTWAEEERMQTQPRATRQKPKLTSQQPSP